MRRGGRPRRRTGQPGEEILMNRTKWLDITPWRRQNSIQSGLFRSCEVYRGHGPKYTTSAAFGQCAKGNGTTCFVKSYDLLFIHSRLHGGSNRICTPLLPSPRSFSVYGESQVSPRPGTSYKHSDMVLDLPKMPLPPAQTYLLVYSYGNLSRTLPSLLGSARCAANGLLRKR